MSLTIALDAHSISTWQACRRRWMLERDYRVIRWRPKGLFDALLRKAIFALSNGGDHVALAAESKAAFLQSAADPGLDIPAGANPYTIARSWCGMFDTILYAIAKSPLLIVREFMPVTLNSWLQWQPSAWMDESGQLHRWITVDAWDSDQLSRTLHGWPVIGDIAATCSPMILHVIEIGRATKDGRSCPWSRAWKHPGLRTLNYRFRKPTGGELSAGWLPYYYNDTRDDPEEWSARMIAEGEWDHATRHLLVEAPTKAQCAEVLRQVEMEALEMRDYLNDRWLWHTIPMARAACDGFIPCPFQPLCYATEIADPATLGLYQLRKSENKLIVMGGAK